MELIWTSYVILCDFLLREMNTYVHTVLGYVNSCGCQIQGVARSVSISDASADMPFRIANVWLQDI